MALSSIERALQAMGSMDKTHPYGLRPEGDKRRLVDELARLCQDLDISPVVIGGLAVNHHGYARFTVDVDILVSKSDAIKLSRRLQETPGWKRYAEGFKNTHLDVGLDIRVEGERTSPGSAETFPDPSALRTVVVQPLPVPALSETLALKVMSGRARDDADVVELLKRHRSRMAQLQRSAARRLRTKEARGRLRSLVARARAEAAGRR